MNKDINKKDYYGRQFWIIELPTYGSFAYYGTEKEAEKRRQEKATWEREIAKKRLATQSKEDCEMVARVCIREFYGGKPEGK